VLFLEVEHCGERITNERNDECSKCMGYIEIK
jgi:hypothetical protein